MAGSELDAAVEAPSDGVKRPREDDSVLPESLHNTDPKKLRPDESVDAAVGEAMEQANEVADKPEEVDGAKGMAEVTEKTRTGDTQDEGQGEDDAGLDTSTDENGAKQDGDTKEAVKEAKLGPKMFTSSVDMLNYFYELLRAWPLNFNVNKYEFMMLEDLITKGHQEPEKKIGAGIEAFQIRMNPEFYSRCYYVVRKDGSMENFSYRKCVDNIMPLPENMRAPPTDLGRKGQGGHKGRNDNRGRGGRFGGGGGRGRGNRGHGGRKHF